MCPWLLEDTEDWKVKRGCGLKFSDTENTQNVSKDLLRVSEMAGPCRVVRAKDEGPFLRPCVIYTGEGLGSQPLDPLRSSCGNQAEQVQLETQGLSKE